MLDLGYGDAEFGLELIKQGCSFYEGVEGPLNMVQKAVSVLDYTASKIQHSSMETWDFPQEQYDLVVSRLALHYLEDLEFVFKQVYCSLKVDGQFVFSVQHPILTSSVQSATKSARADWKADDYFHTGKRIEPWNEKEVVKYHRTIEEYFKELKRAGFKLEEINECSPRLENFKSEEEYRRRMRIPLFLVFACSK
ncbi:class I SAM-dependent methyltransferase [Sporosarcina psychrophila]|uniref:class I SAM-dependent methyltransferase n=1 Tax=Sporosarcina psychrophila TaxID=1476 RepID=UPI000A4763A5